MGAYWVLILIPSLLVVAVSRWIWPHDITLKEWGLQAGALVVSTALCAGGVIVTKYGSMSDHDVLNGYVTAKSSERVTCEHEHKCGETCSGTGKDRSCRPIYCKDHAYDVDWHVDTTVGRVNIDRVNTRGTKEPPRWTEVKLGEPAADEEHVISYLLVDQQRFDATEVVRAKYRDIELPDYPRVYDYYRFNRIVNETKNDYSDIRSYLDDRLRYDGALKQLNVTVLVTERDEDYFDLVNEAWRGVRKNDVVLAYGVNSDGSIKWFRAMTYGDGQGNQAMLSALGTLAINQRLDLALVERQYAVVRSDYVRLPAATFAYLEDSYQPSAGIIVLFVVLNLMCSILVARYLKLNEVA